MTPFLLPSSNTSFDLIAQTLYPTSELTFLLQLLNLVRFKVLFWFRGLNLWVCVHNKIQVS